MTPSTREAAVRYLDRAVFGMLVLLALATAVSPKAIVFAVPAAILWIIKLAVRGQALPRLPLAAPMLALLVAAALASACAYDPLASWTRVRMFGALLLAIIVGETCAGRARLKAVVYTVFFSALLAAGWTLWQYSFGIGVRFHDLPPSLAVAGIAPGDIVLKVNGRPVRSPAAWEQAVQAISPARDVAVRMLKPLTHETITVSMPAAELTARGLGRASAVTVGRPVRAAGFYQHYVPFSEMLTMIAVLAWGLAITARGPGRWGMGAVFLILAACMAATVTRSAIAVLLLACVVLLWQIVGWKLRAVSVGAAAGLLLAGSLWIHHTRGFGWLAPRDAGTQYRLVIWRDGLRLIAQHPLVGVGFDNVVRHPGHWDIQAYRLYPLVSHFHSTPIEYAVDGGLLTLAAWLWLLGAYWMLLRRTLRASVEPFTHGLVLGLLGALFAFFAMSLTQYIGGDSDVMTVFWLMMGLAIGLDRALRQSPQELMPGA